MCLPIDKFKLICSIDYTDAIATSLNEHYRYWRDPRDRSFCSDDPIARVSSKGRIEVEWARPMHLFTFWLALAVTAVLGALEVNFPAMDLAPEMRSRLFVLWNCIVCKVKFAATSYIHDEDDTTGSDPRAWISQHRKKFQEFFDNYDNFLPLEAEFPLSGTLFISEGYDSIQMVIRKDHVPHPKGLVSLGGFLAGTETRRISRQKLRRLSSYRTVSSIDEMEAITEMIDDYSELNMPEEALRTLGIQVCLVSDCSTSFADVENEEDIKAPQMSREIEHLVITSKDVPSCQDHHTTTSDSNSEHATKSLEESGEFGPQGSEQDERLKDTNPKCFNAAPDHDEGFNPQNEQFETIDHDPSPPSSPETIASVSDCDSCSSISSLDDSEAENDNVEEKYRALFLGRIEYSTDKERYLDSKIKMWTAEGLCDFSVGEVESIALPHEDEPGHDISATSLEIKTKTSYQSSDEEEEATSNDEDQDPIIPIWRENEEAPRTSNILSEAEPAGDDGSRDEKTQIAPSDSDQDDVGTDLKQDVSYLDILPDYTEPVSTDDGPAIDDDVGDIIDLYRTDNDEYPSVSENSSKILESDSTEVSKNYQPALPQESIRSYAVGYDESGHVFGGNGRESMGARSEDIEPKERHLRLIQTSCNWPVDLARTETLDNVLVFRGEQKPKDRIAACLPEMWDTVNCLEHPEKAETINYGPYCSPRKPSLQNLPQELQDMIWSFVAEPSAIAVKPYKRIFEDDKSVYLRFEQTTARSNLLSICQSSRKWFKYNNRGQLPTKQGAVEINFHPKKDTIIFTDPFDRGKADLVEGPTTKVLNPAITKPSNGGFTEMAKNDRPIRGHIPRRYSYPDTEQGKKKINEVFKHVENIALATRNSVIESSYPGTGNSVFTYFQNLKFVDLTMIRDSGINWVLAPYPDEYYLDPSMFYLERLYSDCYIDLFESYEQMRQVEEAWGTALYRWKREMLGRPSMPQHCVAPVLATRIASRSQNDPAERQRLPMIL